MYLVEMFVTGIVPLALKENIKGLSKKSNVRLNSSNNLLASHQMKGERIEGYLNICQRLN
jgi:hypothetical protein